MDACFANQSRAGAVVPPAGGFDPDVRSTHAALEGGGPNSHYVLAWMTREEVTLQKNDLYPVPAPGVRLAVRQHVVSTAGNAQFAGCVDGQPASNGCLQVLPKGALPILPAVGASIANFSLIVVHEPLENGAYFLGELTKLVHVSPQRFKSVTVEGECAEAPAGIKVSVKGNKDEVIKLVAVDPRGIVRIQSVRDLPTEICI